MFHRLSHRVALFVLVVQLAIITRLLVPFFADLLD